VWETASAKLLAAMHGHTGVIWCVALSADGQRAGRDQQL